MGARTVTLHWHVTCIFVYALMRIFMHGCDNKFALEVLRAGVLPFAGKSRKFQHEHCASRRGSGTHLPPKIHLLLDFSNASCLLRNSEYNPEDRDYPAKEGVDHERPGTTRYLNPFSSLVCKCTSAAEGKSLMRVNR